MRPYAASVGRSACRLAAIEIEDFIRHCQEGLSHQVNGDSEPFLECWSHADDVAILGAVGSHARGWNEVRTHLLGASRSLHWTTLQVEDISTHVGEWLAVWVGLEHMSRGVDGEASTRTLRTTQAYRLEDGRWRLILRHANTVTADDEERERALLGDRLESKP